VKKIRSHVEEWFKDIPDSEAKETMKEEIVQNLEEKVQDLIRKGKAEEDAINKAIVDFGDIADIKEELGGGLQGRSQRNKYGIHLGFSIWGSVLIIGLMIFINFYTSPDTIWFVYPTFGVLWWPLTMFYRWLANKQ
jgi:hypothetical protein